MESILEIVKEFIVFPLPNVISLMLIMSALWWFLKQRPVEKEETAKAIGKMQEGLSDWEHAIQDNRTQIVEAMASNSNALEKNEKLTADMQGFMNSFNNNCSRLDDTLDGILGTQDALWSIYNKMTEKISDMKTSSIVMDERMKDIEQYISNLRQ